jgi:hypothetical protein
MLFKNYGVLTKFIICGACMLFLAIQYVFMFKVLCLIYPLIFSSVPLRSRTIAHCSHIPHSAGTLPQERLALHSSLPVSFSPIFYNLARRSL